MARSDLIISLVRAGASGDKQLLKSAVEALTADERTKSHHVLADRIQRAYTSVPVAPSLTSATFPTSASGKDAILELTPKIVIDELMLPLPVKQAAVQLIEEHTRADVLRAHGYEPRHRILLSGPPGNGKTSYAEAIAESLGLPFYVVRYDALVGSFLGETNTRLRNLFDYVRTRPSVLFFDEFDSVATERGDTHETGEIKRVVSFLLMQLDQLPSYIVVMAATNHAELLDRAVWRRFQMRLSFPRPDDKELEAFLDRQFSVWPQRPQLPLRKIVHRLTADSYAEAIDFCQNVRRREILGLGTIGVDSALEAELTLWEQRERPEVVNGESADAAAAAESRAGSPT
jgi:AAA+ superfamily predicted ATPase